jgi:CheY-like chemotaxis protein
VSVAAAAHDGGWTAGLTAVSGLLGTLVWPAVVIAVVLIFRRPLVQFVQNLQNATVKAGGAEVTLTARAEAAVVAATVDKAGPGPTQPDDIERAIRSTRAATTALPASGLLGRVALWVDDKPDRPEGRRAGLDLLAAIRKTGNEIPYVVYAASASASDVADAKSRGAFGYTADPSTLLQLVAAAVGGRPS